MKSAASIARQLRALIGTATAEERASSRARSVAVSVVNVGAVRMLVHPLLVNMKVAVRPGNLGIVRVVVVAVIMAMRMLVFDGLVNVPMLVCLRCVQVDGETKEQTRAESREPIRALPEHPRDGGADERRQRKD